MMEKRNTMSFNDYEMVIFFILTIIFFVKNPIKAVFSFVFKRCKSLSSLHVFYRYLNNNEGMENIITYLFNSLTFYWVF